MYESVPTAVPFAPAPAAPARESRVPLTIRIAQAIMLLPLGAVVVFGGTYFGFLHQVEVMNAPKYGVAIWGITQGLLSIFTALKLGSGERFYYTLAKALMCGHLLFGVVKLVFWQESAAIPFMVFDSIVLALLIGAPAPAGASRERVPTPDRNRRRLESRS